MPRSRCLRWSRVVAVVAAVTGMGVGTSGLIDSEQLASSNSAKAVWLLNGELFGFLPGGTLNFTIDCDGPSNRVALVLLTVGQYLEITTHEKPVCPLPHSDVEQHNSVAIIQPPAAEMVRPNGTHFEYSTTFGGNGDFEDRFYYFRLRECPPSVVQPKHTRSPVAQPTMAPTATPNTLGTTCSVRLVTMNPGGEHLSSDQIEIPSIYTNFAVLWGLTLLIWAANWVTFFGASNRLHDLYSVVPPIKLISVMAGAYSYRHKSSTGHSDAELSSTHTLFHFGVITMLFFLSLLSVQGWCVLRNRLDHDERITFAVPLAFFFSMVAEEWIHKYFLGMVIITAIVQAIHILKHSGTNLADLRLRYLEIRNVLARFGEVPDAVTMPLASKRFLIASARLVFVGYALFWALISIMEVYLVDHRDLDVMFNEILWLLTWWALLWVFRLRKPLPKPPQAEAAGEEDEPKPECVFIQPPGGRIDCIGVEVAPEQFVEFSRCEHDRLFDRAADRG